MLRGAFSKNRREGKKELKERKIGVKILLKTY